VAPFLRSIESAYRALLRRGADTIDTNIPAQLGQLLDREIPVPWLLRQ
jgi:hypothetical protein